MHYLKHSVLGAGVSAQGAFELRRRPSGVWAITRNGLYLTSTGFRDRALAARYLSVFVLHLDAEAREAARARAVGLH
ncbi:hypothetical protein ABIB90_004868 [Bradyrhizobium sp. JR4.1]|uniref:hypothetical protein n=1 Tax=Bradyrhizobium sp. JR4.1 TaxID=3156372 RepID=UPI00339763CC